MTKIILLLFCISGAYAQDKIMSTPDENKGEASLSGHKIEEQKEEEQEREEEKKLEEKQPKKEGSVESEDEPSSF